MAHAQQYRPTYDAAADSPEARRSVAKWMLGFLASLALLGALSALVLFQMSLEAPAKQSLRQATAALTEIDASLDRHYEDMQASAEASAPGDTITVPDFPIAITLTSEEVLGTSENDLRALILDRSADRLYADGTGVLRESTENAGSLGVFSVAGFTDRVLGLSTRDAHRLSLILMVVLALLAAGLLITAAAAARLWGRLVTAGVVVALAGSALLVGGAIIRLYSASQPDNSDYLRNELFDISANHATLALRNGAAFAIAGMAIIAIGLAMTRISRKS